MSKVWIALLNNILLIIFISTNTLSSDIKIIASINDKIITNYDVKKEINYLGLLNPNFSELNHDQKIIIAKNALINQNIKNLEISKNSDLEVDENLNKNYLKDLYSNLGLESEEEFLKFLNKKNIDILEVKKKIQNELLWNQFIYLKYKNQLKINEKKILEKVRKMQKKNDKKYFLSEIVFVKKKNKSIEKLIDEIKLSINEIGFSNTATIYSISESSKFGGKIGWVNELSLQKNIIEKLKILREGEYTDIIKFGNNYSIIMIDKIKLEKNVINEKKEIQKLKNMEINQQLQRFSKIYFDKVKLNYFINEI